MVSNTIYCFWTGSNEMSDARKQSLEQLKQVSDMNVILVTKDNLHTYILPDHPLHEAYKYLSETHKSDFLRIYFMNFYGGGYSDIKRATGSWKPAYEEFVKSDRWICGYKEIGPGGVMCQSYKDYWQELIGTGCFICRPNTPFTNNWYSEVLKILDRKLDILKTNPATFPQDCNDYGSGYPSTSGYPLGWTELLGQVFHRVIFDYRDRILQTLPICDLTWGYR
jgi:hypothetical protein